MSVQAEPYISSGSKVTLLRNKASIYFFLLCMTAVSVNAAEVYHVDAVNGCDTNDGNSKETAFLTIQTGINSANDGDTVLVWPGLYAEEITFNGKKITVKSAADAAVIRAASGYAVSFYWGENSQSVFKNFVIADSEYGIYLDNGSSPLLTNITIVNNTFGVSAYGGANPDIRNCIIADNKYGDIFGCTTNYSWVQEIVDPHATDLRWFLAFDEGTGWSTVNGVSCKKARLWGTQWAQGKNDQGLSFDGIDDFVWIPYSAEIESSSDLTIAAWVYWRGSSDNDTILANSGSYWLTLDGSDNLVHFSNGCDPWGQNVISTQTIPLEQWTHILVTRSGGGTTSNSVKIYINGALSSTGNTYAPCATDDNTFIGCWSCGNNEIINPSNCDHHFNGIIDEVFISGKTINASGALHIYQNSLNEGKPLRPIFANRYSGDYHLCSKKGRYDSNNDQWIIDNKTSPCIDSGDPASNYDNERIPHGSRINTGAYGGSEYASLSDFSVQGDVNGDGLVNMLDFAEITENWLAGNSGQ